MAREQGEFLRARVVEIAASVGAPLARDQKKCAPNLFVVLTPQPEQLWAAYKQRSPKMFATLQPQRVERSLSTKPVQVVQNAVLNNADGTVPSDSSNYRLRGSRISSSVTEDITSVIVVVNDAQTGGATFGQLADYVAMVACGGSRPERGLCECLVDSAIVRDFRRGDTATCEADGLGSGLPEGALPKRQLQCPAAQCDCDRHGSGHRALSRRSLDVRLQQLVHISALACFGHLQSRAPFLVERRAVAPAASRIRAAPT